MNNKMVVILGPTASGKTRLAALLAAKVDGEIISADSRQVYRHMDLGTGKDLEDYYVDGKKIETHLIDVVNAGEKYDLFNYRKDFETALNTIVSKNKLPIVCGGSGMYIEAALGLYDLPEAGPDETFKEKLDKLSNEELIKILTDMKLVHNTTDLLERDRLIRAIEVAKAKDHSKLPDSENNKLDGIYDHEPATNLIYGVSLPREVIRERITSRLQKRLEVGLVAEVEALIKQGVPIETLNYYGLEYRYISLYLTGQLSFDQMFTKLNTAIHQFAKRQMTWFRRMEKRGINITWLQPETDVFIDRIVADLNKLSESDKIHGNRASNI